MTIRKVIVGEHFNICRLSCPVGSEKTVDGIITTRFSRPDDYETLLAYYDQNTSPYLTKRAPEIVKERVEAGKATLSFLGDTDNLEKHVVHASIRYDYKYGGQDIIHSEFGTQIVVQEHDCNAALYMRGLDLGRRSMTIQTLVGALYVDKAQGFTLQDIYNNNEGALQGLRSDNGKRLFREYNASAATIEEFESTATVAPPPRTFFRAGVDQLQHHASYLMKTIENPIQTQPGIGQENSNRQFLFYYPDIQMNEDLTKFLKLIATHHLGSGSVPEDRWYQSVRETITQIAQIDSQGGAINRPSNNNASHIASTNEASPIYTGSQLAYGGG